MVPPGKPAVSAEIAVSARPDTLYGLITDLPTLAELTEETYAMWWTEGDSARPGSVFRGSNRNGVHKWTTTCTVTDAEPGRVFAWNVSTGRVPIAHWRYEIADGEGGCRVTESMWDYRPGWLRRIARLLSGVSDRAAANAEHIDVTLHRLKQRAEAA
jgi:Polyketide cyclase / dehydrase and lipid transport